jgi:hypothetical protein
MEWTLLEVVLEFFQDARLYTILGLIVLDVVMGVAVAIKNGQFEWWASRWRLRTGSSSGTRSGSSTGRW